jgi:hypothetical protein
MHPPWQIGQTVLYVPDPCYALNKDSAGQYCFHFVWAEGPLEGQRAEMNRCGELIRTADGQLRARSNGRVLRPDGPRSYWQATLLETLSEGVGILDIQHPNGCGTLHSSCPYDPGKGLHTFHLPGE